jgi:hypothetical protein
MRKRRHPLSGAMYEVGEDGLVLVVGRDGRSGRFRPDGSWVDGELRQADPHLCAWLGGPQVGAARVSADASARGGER